LTWATVWLARSFSVADETGADGWEDARAGVAIGD
jgi:hypothetical protein